MEEEFWISVELLSLGGNVCFTVIKRKRCFELLLDDQEFGRIYKDKFDNWQDLDGTLPSSTCPLIGTAIESLHS